MTATTKSFQAKVRTNSAGGDQAGLGQRQHDPAQRLAAASSRRPARRSRARPAGSGNSRRASRRRRQLIGGVEQHQAGRRVEQAERPRSVKVGTSSEASGMLITATIAIISERCARGNRSAPARRRRAPPSASVSTTVAAETISCSGCRRPDRPGTAAIVLERRRSPAAAAADTRGSGRSASARSRSPHRIGNSANRAISRLTAVRSARRRAPRPCASDPPRRGGTAPAARRPARG